MTPVCKDIFKAIHEGKWLKIEYRNKSGDVTKYWIGIENIDVQKRMLTVQGMHLGTHDIERLHVYIDSILSSVILEGTYCPINTDLISDIATCPDKYLSLFDNVANLKILSYLEMCSKLDTTPYNTEYELIKYLDGDSFSNGEYKLNNEQFNEIVRSFSVHADKKKKGYEKLRIKQLAMNVLSIHTNKGLYTLAYLINQSLKDAGLDGVACGTVHSFQGDEKDVILFSTAIGDGTQNRTYEWLKTNRELINVATSRAKNKLIVLADMKNVERLHGGSDGEDDLYELLNYVRSEGKTTVTPKQTNSRALGVKPFSTETESAFLDNLTHALENIWLTQSKFTVHKEVAISQVFENNPGCESLFYTGRFDFVVYEKNSTRETPVLAIELDGKEHLEDAAVKRRDEQKNKICREHNLQLIRVENMYARRYNYIKSILMSYFAIRH